MIGTKTDTKQRIRLARADSVQRRAKIESARKLLFDSGLSITNERIEYLLRPTSLVPTRVSVTILLLHYYLTSSTHLECLFRAPIRSWLQFL
jgi:hypothetical protein